MTLSRCDRCNVVFDDCYWHPVVFDDSEAELREFCSIDCRRRFLDDGTGEV